MSGIVYAIIFLVVIVLIIVALTAIRKSKRKPGRRPSYPKTRIETAEDREVKAAGNWGEKEAKAIIKSVLKKGDVLLNNVSIEYDDNPAEMDNVIINRKGVFIIEVKYYRGKLFGREDDFEWQKYKLTDGGNVFEKDVKNPIVQVRRQEGLLGNYLRDCGADVWVKGYAYLLEENSPVKCETMLRDKSDIEYVIHTGRNLLDDKEVQRIKELLQ